MIQSFQCPVCGTLNALGEPECSECGQVFVYNCPVCGSPLNNRYPACPNCHTIFNWGVSPRATAVATGPVVPNKVFEPQPTPEISPGRGEESGAAGFTQRPIFWVILIIICAVLIALLLIIDGLINK
ncbi:MAG: hypothetical protein PHY03_06245 [Dehalococcoidia bacterium]|nr:hypothetical protein [Dehalococcoidia bacterium]